MQLRSPRALLRDARVASLAVLAASSLVAACASEPKLSPITAAAHQSAWTKWRGTRTAWLSTPGRPMSYTGLTWLREGASTVGGDSTNAIRMPGRDVPATIGTLMRTGHTVRFEPAIGVAVTIDSVPAVATTLRTDNVPKPSVVSAGTAGFRIMQRVDSLGVRTWDADRVTPEMVARQIGPLEYFPLDGAWRLAGRLQRREKPETVAVATSSGVAEVHIILGAVQATIGARPYRLTAFAGSNATDLMFTFSDESSGEETYGFRFLHAAIDTVTQVVTLDFNYAYNPDCAFSAFTTCPLPPDENRIGVRIPAGERAVKYLSDSTHASVERAKRMVEKGRGARAASKAASKP